MITTLPLAGSVDDVKGLNKDRESFEVHEPDCRNTHHLLADLLTLERGYREATNAFTQADAEAKALKKRMDAQGEKVHALLVKIQDRRELPLFETAAA